jgi:Zn-finger nucleic acid-binding protein
MTRMNFGTRSGIILDVCRAHGTWFDRGELDAVLSFVRDGGLEDQVAPPGPPTKSAEAEALLRVAQAELRAEAVQQENAVERVTDLMLVLFGPRFRRW